MMSEAGVVRSGHDAGASLQMASLVENMPQPEATKGRREVARSRQNAPGG
jgi:hypothetical protein